MSKDIYLSKWVPPSKRNLKNDDNEIIIMSEWDDLRPPSEFIFKHEFEFID